MIPQIAANRRNDIPAAPTQIREYTAAYDPSTRGFTDARQQGDPM